MKIHPSLAIAASLLPCLTGHALVRIGEGQLDLTLSSTVTYDSQIRSRDGSGSDTIISLSPTLNYSREAPAYALSAGLGLEIVRFVDNGQFDDENLFFTLSVSPSAITEGDRFVFNSSINMAARTEARPEIGEIVTSRNYSATAGLLYRPNKSFSIRTTANYGLDDPDGPYSQLESISLGSMISVPISETYSADAGITFTQTDSGDSLSTANDTFTYYGGLGINFSEKLKGSIHTGWQERDLEEGQSDSNPYLSVSLNWLIDASTSAGFSASQTVGNTIADQTSETLSLRGSVNRTLRRGLGATAVIGYSESKLSGIASGERKDEEITVEAGLSYALTDWGTIGMDISHSDRSSSEAAFSYSRLRAGLSFRATW